MKLLTCTWMACSSSSHSSSIICKRLSTGRKSTSLQDLGICVDGWQRRKCSLSDSLCARMNMQARGPMNTHWSWISSGFGPKYIYIFFRFSSSRRRLRSFETLTPRSSVLDLPREAPIAIRPSFFHIVYVASDFLADSRSKCPFRLPGCYYTRMTLLGVHLTGASISLGIRLRGMHLISILRTVEFVSECL